MNHLYNYFLLCIFLCSYTLLLELTFVVRLYSTWSKGVLISVGTFGQCHLAKNNLICDMSDPVVFNTSMHPKKNY